MKDIKMTPLNLLLFLVIAYFFNPLIVGGCILLCMQHYHIKLFSIVFICTFTYWFLWLRLLAQYPDSFREKLRKY